MTEAEWFATDDAVAMLEFLRGEATDRKLRLFAVACLRSEVKRIFKPGRAPKRPDVDLAERYADGLVTDEERAWAWKRREGQREEPWEDPEQEALAADPFFGATRCVQGLRGYYEEAGPKSAEELRVVRKAQAALVRDIFGNPFQTIHFDPKRHTPSVTGLAQSMYSLGEFDSMPRLREALLDAGCNIPELLAHCWTSGPHVRGCWVVDFCLGKE
jgi:hypothetical protein